RLRPDSLAASAPASLSRHRRSQITRRSRAPPGRGRRVRVRTVNGYLDAATAAPLHPVAREALLAALGDGWADPDRLYARARRARQLLDAARAATAESLGI